MLRFRVETVCYPNLPIVGDTKKPKCRPRAPDSYGSIAVAQGKLLAAGKRITATFGNRGLTGSVDAVTVTLEIISRVVKSSGERFGEATASLGYFFGFYQSNAFIEQ